MGQFFSRLISRLARHIRPSNLSTTGKRPLSRIEALPAELIAEIFGYFCIPSPERAHWALMDSKVEQRRKNKTTLSHLCLVSSSLLPHARYTLYRTIVITQGRTLALLMTTLSTRYLSYHGDGNRDLCKLIHHIVLDLQLAHPQTFNDPPEPDIKSMAFLARSLLYRATNLLSLRIDSLPQPASLHARPYTRICFLCQILGDVAMPSYQAVLAALSNLQRLELPSLPSEEDGSNHIYHWGFFHSANLKSVTLTGNNGLWNRARPNQPADLLHSVVDLTLAQPEIRSGQWQHLHKLAPNLRRLCITEPNQPINSSDGYPPGHTMNYFLVKYADTLASLTLTLRSESPSITQATHKTMFGPKHERLVCLPEMRSLTNLKISANCLVGRRPRGWEGQGEARVRAKLVVLAEILPDCLQTLTLMMDWPSEWRSGGYGNRIRRRQYRAVVNALFVLSKDPSRLPDLRELTLDICDHPQLGSRLLNANMLEFMKMQFKNRGVVFTRFQYPSH